MKKCCHCQEEKELIEFCKNKNSKDGYDYKCRKCNALRYQENKEKWAPAKRKYDEKNREYLLLKKREYCAAHRKEKEAYDKIYRKNNRDKIKQYKINWENRNKNNPILKVKRNLRRRIHHVLVNRYKSDSTMNLLGCAIEDFFEYLESKFKEGMTWQNYGSGADKWHIDHIKPCCDFDLTREEEQRKCFHYTNMQPLWQKDNLKKAYIFEGRNCRINSSNNHEIL